MKVQIDTDETFDPLYVNITGPGYCIRIKEIEPGVLLVTSLTDDCRNQLVVRPRSCNEILLSRNLVVPPSDLAECKLSVGRPHRVLDAHALDVWMDQTYSTLYEHWRNMEAEKMDLWEYIGDHHPDVWREFEKWFLAKMLESGGSIV